MKTELAEHEKKLSDTNGSTTSFSAYPWLKALLQMIPALLIGLVLLEGIFYLARVGESDHLMPDHKLGFKPFANKRITQRKEGFGSFQFNSFGMQNDQITLNKPINTYRIAVLGDSYVESLQVPRESNYCSLLAKELSHQLGKPTQVLNFGVSNYSLAQDYLRYQTLAKDFKPDLVIVAYRVGETEKVLPDNRQSLAFVRPVLFADQNGQLIYNDSAVANFYRAKEGRRLLKTQVLREYSRTWSIVGRMQQSWTTVSKDIQTNATSTLIADEKTREKFAACYWYMVDSIFKNFAKDCASNHTAMLIMRTPMVHPGEYILTRNKVETDQLETTAREIKADFINIDELLQLSDEKHDYRPYFLEGSHFSKKMHKFVADNLAKHIASKISHSSKESAH